jgi:hypothetical protein
LKNWKIEKDITNKLTENKEKCENIMKGGGGVVKNSKKQNERQKQYEKGRSKLFEPYLKVVENIVKGSKLFKPYL